jgi:hypothetical protein
LVIPGMRGGFVGLWYCVRYVYTDGADAMESDRCLVVVVILGCFEQVVLVSR